MRPPSDLLEQIGSLIAHDSWEPVLVSAAESARDPRGQLVSQELVEGEMPLEVTHDMVMGVRLVDLPAGAECAAKMLEPELEPFDPERQGKVWIALMVWFALKCGAIGGVVRREMGQQQSAHWACA